MGPPEYFCLDREDLFLYILQHLMRACRVWAVALTLIGLVGAYVPNLVRSAASRDLIALRSDGRSVQAFYLAICELQQHRSAAASIDDTDSSKVNFR